MSKKKSKQKAPEWAVNKDSRSKFDMLYIDLIQSDKFLSLDRSAQMFYIICRVNYHDPKALACLSKIIREDYESPLLGDEYEGVLDEEIIRTEIATKYADGYFVMPAKHMEKYGYCRQQGGDLMKKLIAAGFIEKVQCNKNRRKVNIYKFSTRWKKSKTRAVHNLQK